MRAKTLVCTAALKLKGSELVHKRAHVCDARPQQAKVRLLQLELKQKAANERFRPTGAIIDEVLLENYNNSEVRRGNLLRMANRVCQSTRPNHPETLDFVFEKQSGY